MAPTASGHSAGGSPLSGTLAAEGRADAAAHPGDLLTSFGSGGGAMGGLPISQKRVGFGSESESAAFTRCLSKNLLEDAEAAAETQDAADSPLGAVRKVLTLG